jgi:hypothetical protein
MNMESPHDEDWSSASTDWDIDEEFVRFYELQDSRHGRVRSWLKGVGPRFEEWKLARSRDGDFSSFLDWHEQMVIVPALALLITVLIFGMGLSYVVDIDLVRRIVAIVFLASVFVSVPLRYIILFALRQKVYHYTQDRVDGRWILDIHGQVEDVHIIDEYPFDE